MKRPLFMALALCAAAFVFVTSRDLPSVVATHFSFSGAANGFMARNTYLVFMLALAVGLPVALVVASPWWLARPDPRVNIPHRAHWFAAEHRERTVRYLQSGIARLATLLLAFLCYTHWLVVLAHRQQPPALPGWPFACGLAVFVAVVIAWTVAVHRRFRRAA